MLILICRRGDIRRGVIRSIQVGSLWSYKGVVLSKLVVFCVFPLGVIRRFGFLCFRVLVSLLHLETKTIFLCVP